MELLCHMLGNPMFNLLRERPVCFPKWLHCFTFPRAVNSQGFPLLHILPTFVVTWPFETRFLYSGSVVIYSVNSNQEGMFILFWVCCIASVQRQPCPLWVPGPEVGCELGDLYRSLRATAPSCLQIGLCLWVQGLFLCDQVCSFTVSASFFPSPSFARDLEARAQNEFFRAFFRLPRREKLHAVVDCSLWTPFSRCHTAGRMFTSDSYICFASKEDSCCNVILPLREVATTLAGLLSLLVLEPLVVVIRLGREGGSIVFFLWFLRLPEICKDAEGENGILTLALLIKLLFKSAYLAITAFPTALRDEVSLFSHKKGTEKTQPTKSITLWKTCQITWLLYPPGTSVENVQNASFNMGQVPSSYKIL